MILSKVAEIVEAYSGSLCLLLLLHMEEAVPVLPVPRGETGRDNGVWSNLGIGLGEWFRPEVAAEQGL